MKKLFLLILLFAFLLLCSTVHVFPGLIICATTDLNQATAAGGCSETYTGGNENAYSDEGALSGDYRIADDFTTGVGESGTVCKIYVYVDSCTGTKAIKVGIYDDSSGPDALLGEGIIEGITSADDDTWVSVDVSGESISLSASTTYWVAAIAEDASITIGRTDVGAPSGAAYDYEGSAYANGFENPFDEDSTSWNMLYSLYCTFG